MSSHLQKYNVHVLHNADQYHVPSCSASRRSVRKRTLSVLNSCFVYGKISIRHCDAVATTKQSYQPRYLGPIVSLSSSPASVNLCIHCQVVIKDLFIFHQTTDIVPNYGRRGHRYGVLQLESCHVARPSCLEMWFAEAHTCPSCGRVPFPAISAELHIEARIRPQPTTPPVDRPRSEAWNPPIESMGGLRMGPSPGVSTP